jgi:hypothetical protein
MLQELQRLLINNENHGLKNYLADLEGLCFGAAFERNFQLREKHFQSTGLLQKRCASRIASNQRGPDLQDFGPARHRDKYKRKKEIRLQLACYLPLELSCCLIRKRGIAMQSFTGLSVN